MAYNKFIKNDGTVMLDLTDTTVSEETLGKDITAVDKYGNKIVGTLTDSPLPVEVSTEEEMAELLTSGEVSSVYKYIGTSGTYENNALYEITEKPDPLQGTWVWNDTLTAPSSNLKLRFNFNSNSTDYVQFIISTIPMAGYNKKTSGVGTVVYRDSAWEDNNFKTIIINSTYDEVVSLNDETKAANLLSFLQANATKQASRTFEKLIVPMGTLDINENGAYNVTEYANVDVSVDSPLPVEISTEEEMNELLTSGELNGIYKYTGETTEVYEKDSLYRLYYDPYLTFSSPEAFTLNINDNTKRWDGTLEYSTDKETWTEWDGTTTISSSADGILYLRGTGNTHIIGSGASGDDSKGYWVLTGSDISCIGSIETLLDYQTVMNGGHPTMADYCYASMFYDCTSLTTAPELPATTLAEDCYLGMFWNCTNLTTAPKLPATTLTSSCYSGMFSNCTSLTTAPELPATTLAEDCYLGMFRNCTSLTTTPELPATTLTENCYSTMFYNCTSLTTAPELPATTLAQECYYGMFGYCTSLTTPPELPATTLANSCYGYMFSNCTNLTTAPELPITTLTWGCYQYMFENCTNLTTAPELPATELAGWCYRDMFSNCTSLITTPELPATTLAESCYNSMFQNCTNLTTLPKLPATTLANWCYNSMFYDCTNIKLSETQTEEYTTPYRIPTSGDGTVGTDSLTDMFTSTGGTSTGTPTINTTYYLHNSNSVV